MASCSQLARRWQSPNNPDPDDTARLTSALGRKRTPSRQGQEWVETDIAHSPKEVQSSPRASVGMEVIDA